MKSLLFVFNPKSGKGQLASNLMEILNIFASYQYTITVHPTQEPMDGYRTILEQAAGYDLLVISGGDGTVSECVRALMQLPKNQRPPIGYIPSGTVNDFASSRGLSKNMVTAARDIMDGCRQLCDIGGFEDTFFAYVAAFGAFTDVAYDTPQESKNLFGNLAYVFEGLKRVPDLKSYRLHIDTGKEQIEGDYLFGMVANTTSIGGIRVKFGDIALNDGLSELILVKASSSAALSLPAIFTAVARQDFSSPHFVYRKVKSAVLSSQEPIPWTIDGEYGGLHEAVTVDTHKEALAVIVPQKKTPRSGKH